MGNKLRSVEGSSPCSAPAETVWEVWTDPSAWPGDVIEMGTVDGDFAVGARVGVKVKGGVKTYSTLTRVERPAIWTSETTFPGLKFTYEHTIQNHGAGTLLTERVIMSGVLAGVAHRLLRSRLEETFTAVTGYIGRLAEARLPR
ncbi:SRPBCC family protein [Mycolicibacterium monacense]|uniref:SRPBCC family protein n=1 Tax=Mycolicibacterium monacense TaxID=85693 RepID=UPI0009EE5EB9|nr:SRPBCC family protein [Mycolicibacterium monacense]